MTKRSFFKSIMGLAATVALAPEIAFGVKLRMPVVEAKQWVFWCVWKNGDELETTLTQPCTEEAQTKFILRAWDLVHTLPVPCAYTFTGP